MTEHQKYLRAHFLEPEIRDGVAVSAELKAIWKVMLDIFEEFVRVCEKYELKYVMDGGSLLGAARHKGFIPWDDDIDVAMPRKDYDKFMKVAPAELPRHLLLQTVASEKDFHVAHAMLRDIRTAGIDPMQVSWGKRFNQGIRIDILPLDAMPPKVLFKPIQWWCSLIMSAVPPRPEALSDRPWVVKKIKRFLGFSLLIVCGGRRGIYFMRELPFRICSAMFKGWVGSLAPRNFWHPHSLRSDEWMSPVVKTPFEYLEVCVPAGYDQVLTQQYKDWRTPSKGGGWHGELIFDVERPWLEVAREKIKGFKD